MTPEETLTEQVRLLRKWAQNLGPAPKYLSPAALAKEMHRMANTLESCADDLAAMRADAKL